MFCRAQVQRNNAIHSVLVGNLSETPCNYRKRLKLSKILNDTIHFEYQSGQKIPGRSFAEPDAKYTCTSKNPCLAIFNTTILVFVVELL